MIGKIVSHYKLFGRLSGGNMGIVYKTEDLKIKRFVSLKFLLPEMMRDSETRKRFIHEGQSASALDHPNIYLSHEIDAFRDDKIFISMADYRDGIATKENERGSHKLEDAPEIAIELK